MVNVSEYELVEISMSATVSICVRSAAGVRYGERACCLFFFRDTRI